MTITINLDPEKEARLRQKAARAGRPVEQLAQDFVLRGVDEPEREEFVTAITSNEPTLAELFAGRTGLVDSNSHLNSSLPEEEPSMKEGPTQLKQTLAEALAGHIGTQHSGRSDLSQNTGQAFTRLMIEKRKAGQL